MLLFNRQYDSTQCRPVRNIGFPVFLLPLASSKTHPRGLAALVLCAMMAVPLARSQPKYKVTTLSGAGFPARAINTKGQIVGGGDNSYLGGSAFLWTNGTVTSLVTMAGGYTGSSANAINSSGQIAGYAYGNHNQGIQDQAFLYGGGAMISLGCVGDLCGTGFGSSYAYGMNDSGQIVGEVDTNAVSFLYTGGVMTPFNLTGENCQNQQSDCTVTVATAINNRAGY
jgi:probable HAF family extracellular repeat protein